MPIQGIRLSVEPLVNLSSWQEELDRHAIAHFCVEPECGSFAVSPVDATVKVLKEAYGGIILAGLGAVSSERTIGFLSYDQRLAPVYHATDLSDAYRKAIEKLLSQCGSENVGLLLQGGHDGKPLNSDQRQSHATDQMLRFGEVLTNLYPSVPIQCTFSPPSVDLDQKAALLQPMRRQLVLFEERYGAPDYIKADKRSIPLVFRKDE